MPKGLTIRMMSETVVVIFHYCERTKAMTKVMLRMDFDKFVEKKFKPLKCSTCELKMSPDEVVFDYFRERIMGGE